MKFISLFLSMLVLVLTTVPCCALAEKDAHVHQVSPQEKAKPCPESEDNCCKDCSPFYVCGTCIGFTLAKQTSFGFVISLKPVQHNTVYISTELPLIPVIIWQPPKLS